MNTAEFKKLLEAERQALQTKLSSLTEEKIAVDVDGDDVDEVQGAFINGMNATLSSRDINRLEKITAALLKIRDGVFGVCEECGEDIDEKRLKFSPECVTCIGCAEALERKAKFFK